MKKLLAILGLVSLTVPNISATIVVSSNVKIKVMQVDYSTDSFTNIIKIINAKYDNSENMENQKINGLLEGIVPNYYYNYINQENEGEVLTWDAKERGDTKIIKSYVNEYKNPDDLPQKRLTQSRTETVAETHTFAMNLTEKIAVGTINIVEGKLSLPLGVAGIKESISFKFDAEVGSAQSWSDSTTKTITESVPSQEIMQNPHTILHVKYTITQSTWDFNGIARFKINNLLAKVFNIPFFYFDQQGNFDHVIWNSYSVKDIVGILKEMGYEKELDTNQTEKYSVLSVDNVSNPSKAFINLPISWTSPDTSGIILDHYEEPYYG